MVVVGFCWQELSAVQTEALFKESLQQEIVSPEVLKVITAGLAEEFAKKVFESMSVPVVSPGSGVTDAPSGSHPVAVAVTPVEPPRSGAGVLMDSSHPSPSVSPFVIEPVAYVSHSAEYRPTPAGCIPTYYHDVVSPCRIHPGIPLVLMGTGDRYFLSCVLAPFRFRFESRLAPFARMVPGR